MALPEVGTKEAPRLLREKIHGFVIWPYLATELLYQRLSSTPPRDPLQPVRLRLEPRLIVRESVRRVRS